MAQMTPDTVAIQRLRIRCESGAASARLRREIEGADWPEAPGESWVFIRKLHVRAPLNELAPRLARSAREYLDGRGGEDLVRFATLSEMLAALLGDLVRGTAPGLWHWRSWSRLFSLPLPRAVASLLLENIAHLPAVCARLCRQGALEPVWLALDEAGAGQLGQALAWRGGFSPPQADEVARAGKARPAGAELRIGAGVRQRWAPLLRRLPERDARYQLALLLIAQEVAPLLLRQAAAPLLACLGEALVSQTGLDRPAAGRTEPAGGQRTQPEARGGAARQDHVSPSGWSGGATGAAAPPPAGRAPETPRPETPPRPGRTEAAQSGPAASRPAGLTMAGSDAGPAAPEGSGQGNYAALSERQASSAPTPFQALRLNPRPRDPACGQFHTRQGGLLFLLNLLNRGEVQSLMAAHLEQLPSAWGWLYRLGQELKLDETDPIAGYIATQLGFDHPAEMEQLPPLPARAELLELARAWYGRTGLWQPDLLLVPARIQYSPSHLDLHAPLDAVRLPVRLAGLDINPGWLPWLGRVVNIHYD